MKYKLMWDLDGVIRGLHEALEHNFNCIFKEWSQKIFDPKQDKFLSIFEIIENNKEILLEKRFTKFFNEFLQDDSIDRKEWFIEIWTHQPESWIPYTQKYIEKYVFPTLGFEVPIRYISSEEKLLILDNNYTFYLLEDKPSMGVNTNVIMVDRLYNRHAHCFRRVDTWEEVKQLGWE